MAALLIKMKKSVTIIILVFIVVAFAGAMYYLYQKNSEDPVVYETETPTKHSIVKKEVATGSILPLDLLTGALMSMHLHVFVVFLGSQA